VSPVRYEMGFYIPEDDILHSHRREILKSYIIRNVHLVIDAVTISVLMCLWLAEMDPY
jgi:hypothetical protein